MLAQDDQLQFDIYIYIYICTYACAWEGERKGGGDGEGTRVEIGRQREQLANIVADLCPDVETRKHGVASSLVLVYVNVERTNAENKSYAQALLFCYLSIDMISNNKEES